MSQSLFTDALLAGLKGAPVTLRRIVARKHHKELGRELWQEAVFACHLQDNRLTQKEREVIAAIGHRLHGHRSVV